MSEWKSFKELPFTGQTVIVIDDKIDSRKAGVFIEDHKEYFIGVAGYDGEGMGIKLSVQMIPVRYFTHWKEV